VRQPAGSDELRQAESDTEPSKTTGKLCGIHLPLSLTRRGSEMGEKLGSS
jgi:hypothetical protein